MRGSARAMAFMIDGVTTRRRIAGTANRAIARIARITSTAKTVIRENPPQRSGGDVPIPAGLTLCHPAGKEKDTEVGSGPASADGGRDPAQVFLEGDIGNPGLVHQRGESALPRVGAERFHDGGVGAGAPVGGEPPEGARHEEISQGERAIMRGP